MRVDTFWAHTTMAELNLLVRIADADLDGKKQTLYALRKIKGVNTMLAHAVCNRAAVDPKQQIGALSDEKIKKITECIKEPLKNGIPVWLVNRRRDPETGEDGHNVSTELIIANDNDIKTMKKIKSYKGVRHMHGQPTRGQRTRSNFRKSGIAVGGKRPKQGKKS